MPEDEELVTIYETDFQPQVAIIKLALDDAGIPYIAVNDVVSTIFPVDGMAVVKFQVIQRDAERARRVLAQLGLISD